MTEQNRNFPEFYVTNSHPCPYLPDRDERKLFTHLHAEKSPDYVDNLLKNGFRRSQKIAYLPYCDGCRACVSVRIVAEDFTATRSMRRIRRQNQDLIATKVPPRITDEQYNLFQRYVQTRHSDGGMSEMDENDFQGMIEECIPETYMTEYRICHADGKAGPLVAVALSDDLSDGVSMVYSFFDTDMEKRSLGSYLILEHIDQVLACKKRYVYLGYWVNGCRKMSYKTRFQPQEHLTGEGWRPFD